MRAKSEDSDFAQTGNSHREKTFDISVCGSTFLQFAYSGACRTTVHPVSAQGKKKFICHIRFAVCLSVVSQIYAQSREQKVCTGVTGNEPVAALDSHAVLPLVSHFSRDKEWGCDGFSAVPPEASYPLCPLFTLPLWLSVNCSIVLQVRRLKSVRLNYS